MLALHLIAKLSTFVLDLLKKKNELTEKGIINLKDSFDNLSRTLASNMEAIHRLEERMRAVENLLIEVNKFKGDLRMLFQAVKDISGEKWPELKKRIMEDIL